MCNTFLLGSERFVETAAYQRDTETLCGPCPVAWCTLGTPRLVSGYSPCPIPKRRNVNVSDHALKPQRQLEHFPIVVQIWVAEQDARFGRRAVDSDAFASASFAFLQLWPSGEPLSSP